MDKGLRILILEDVPTDAELVERELNRAGIRFSSKRVETREDFLKELREFAPDIILSDYMLPQFDGMAALELTKEFAATIPFIVVTGSMNEETAVECMKAGAADYVIKTHLARLAPAVEGALESKQVIEEKEQAEEALRLASAYNRGLIEASLDLLVVIGPDGKITDVNAATEIVTGNSRKELVGLVFSGLFTNPDKAREGYHQMFREGLVRDLEMEIQHRDGHIRSVSLNASVLRDQAGRIIGVFAAARDISERKRAEEALCQAEEKYRSIFENAVEGIFQSTPAGRFISVNPAFVRMLDYESSEEIITSITDIGRQVFVEPARRAEFRQLLEEHRVIKGFEFQAYRKDGSKIWVSSNARAVLDASGAVIQYEGTSVDITESKKAEEEMAVLQEQFRQSQKMEAIGQLAGGIAHDFNNLLTVIKGYNQLSLLELKEGDPLKGNLEEVKKASERAADLTRHLLAFSRRQILEMKVLDLNTVLGNLDKMLRRVIGEDIELVALLSEDLGRVQADPGQIEQVVMNLAVNARDAMPDGGKLTIETANVELDEEYTRNHIAVKPGRYVMLSVSDKGVGMTPEVKERVFEPFFTTKEKGQGTGLGLSTVYGIVKQSEGNIWVYSELGKGTTFKIYLPRVEEPLEEVVEKVVMGELPRGDETILVVEDDDVVRKLAVEVLRRQGYMVLEAPQGLDAFLICAEHDGPIHLLLTDVVMPKMSGRELAESLASVRSGIKVIYMSGYTGNAIVHHGVLGKGMNYIQKPFTVEELARKVREVLDK